MRPTIDLDRSLLPALRRAADDLAAEAVDHAPTTAPVRCAAGCSACCRQLVPLVPDEVEAIRDVISAMPTSRRDEVLHRARAARRAAELADLGPALDEAGGTTLASRRRLSAAWFALGHDCPFLEQARCSIYADRPLACREYLVSNEPSACSTPTEATITRVRLLGSPSEAWRRAAQALGDPEARTIIPLVTAILAAGSSPSA